jgi:hypothetical protein
LRFGSNNPPPATTKLTPNRGFKLASLSRLLARFC